MADFFKKHLFKFVFLVLIVGLLLWVKGAYNQMVSLETQVDTSWAQVENQYQRRVDLVPSLVNSVQGAMKQEQAVFGAIAEARTRYSGAQKTSEKVAAAGQLEGALARLLVVMENYPQLKSTETVQTLMTQLEGTENRISVERQRYNDVVGLYNQTIRSFPSNLMASMFGFEKKDFFKAQEGANVAPKVAF